MANVYQFNTLEEVYVTATRTVSVNTIIEGNEGGPGPEPEPQSTRPASGQMWPRGDKVPGQ